MREHGASPEDYLHYVHDIDLASLAPMPACPGDRETSGRRFVFTNGCRDPCRAHPGAAGHDGLCSTRLGHPHHGFSAQAPVEAYHCVVAASGVACGQAAMFDDLPRNLVPAARMGMTTIWLKSDAPWGKHGPLMDVAPGDIDHETDNLTQFLKSIRI
jgi:putative hydrolase of the HAD superfamily